MRPLAALAIFYIALGAALRVVLWAVFARRDLGVASLLWVVPVGAVADFLQALYLLAPLALVLWLVPDRWLRLTWLRGAMLASAFVWIAGLVFVAFIEYYFFAEFDSRFNLVAVDYLMYPTEVIGDIEAEYPLTALLIAAASIGAASLFLLRRPLVQFDSISTLRSRTHAFAGYLLALLACVFFLDTSFLAHSSNRLANEVAINGASSFFRALRTSELDYRAFYRSRDAQDNLRRLTRQLVAGGGTLEPMAMNPLNRSFAAKPGLGRFNIVIVMEESLGSEFSKLFDGARDLTPNLDRIAQKGLWFSNAYSSGTRTVRGLEAITASFPPTPAESIVRRPGNENVATLGKVLRSAGYSTSFLYGGRGYFDNMNAFFSGNGYEVIDQTQISRVRFQNIWGVSDEDLFDKAIEHFDELAARDKPFLAQIMTTSNHKPFTFRSGVPGVPPTGGGREAGVRYADFALGYFLQQARRHAWFERTIFVVVADHGARVYGRVEIPLKTYEIPLIMWSPGHIAPRRVDTLTGQIDIAPTLLGLLGMQYTAPFFGQDVLAPSAAPRIALFNHNFDVALYRDGQLAVLGLQKQSSTYTYERSTNEFKRVPTNSELENLAIAYYQTAFELFRAHRYR